MIGGASGFEIPRGRWVSLEQEVELNTPGVADGTLRVWIDGSLVLDASVPYRQKLGAITGVLSEAVATNKDVSPKAKDQKISISPFVVYWAPAQ